jgi:hypothetical protein
MMERNCGANTGQSGTFGPRDASRILTFEPDGVSEGLNGSEIAKEGQKRASRVLTNGLQCANICAILVK